MKFIDLERQQERIREDVDARLGAVLNHGQYILGPEVYELEEKLADYVGVDHCIGVASGTDALLIALMAIGLEPGDEVIVPAFSFFATAEVVCLLGAQPVFVDIDPKYYTINVQALTAAVTSKTKAIIPVGMFGQCCDMSSLVKVADAHGIAVIEDAAQTFGAKHHNRRSCDLSSIGCTSFFPSKPLGAYGDAGACFTNDEELAAKIRQIRIHGQSERYRHTCIGLNGRLDTVQAAVLLAKLQIFPEELQLREKIARWYGEYLSLDLPIEVPSIMDGNSHVYAQYTILTKDRDHLKAALTKDDIPTAIHYPVPLHKQKALASSGVEMPMTESACRGVLSLPMHPYLKKQEVEYICAKISAFFEGRR